MWLSVVACTLGCCPDSHISDAAHCWWYSWFFLFREIHSVNKLTARSGIKHGRDASWERKMFVQFFVTTLCLPVFDIPFISLSYLHNPSPWLGYFVTIMYTLSCSVNGWVYIIMNKVVRRSVKRMFHCLKSIPTKAEKTDTTVLQTTPFMERKSIIERWSG